MARINDLPIGQRFEFLTSLCQYYDHSFTIEWTNGKYVPGEYLDLDDMTAEPLPEHIKQGDVGWTVEVGGWAHDGLLSTLDKAINAAIQIVIEKIGPIPSIDKLSRPK